jgi:hypothetical protein
MFGTTPPATASSAGIVPNVAENSGGEIGKLGVEYGPANVEPTCSQVTAELAVPVPTMPAITASMINRIVDLFIYLLLSSPHRVLTQAPGYGRHFQALVIHLQQR